MDVVWVCLLGDFNPRLREGGDFFLGRCCTLCLNFNPRLREGGDVYDSSGQIVKYISIHASEKEATLIFCICFHIAS